MFEWFRAIHIIGVIAWMAGLLIYPRLLVYRLEAAGRRPVRGRDGQGRRVDPQDHPQPDHDPRLADGRWR